MKFNSHSVLSLLALKSLRNHPSSSAIASAVPFNKGDEALYLSKFNDLIADSYSALDYAPSGLLAECRMNGGAALFDDDLILPERVVTSTNSSSSIISAAAVSEQCQSDDDHVCVIPAGMTLRIDSNLNLAALIIRGDVQWTDMTQSSAVDQWVCAGFIVVEDGGVFNLELESESRNAWIYIKDNGATHPKLQTRVLGAAGGDPTETNTLMNVKGRSLARTWSLLATDLDLDHTSIFLMHDPVLMGWRIGDRITVAPTKALGKGEGESFQITGFGPNNEVNLSGPAIEHHMAESVLNPNGSNVALRSAEVINLSRNVIITGDDFRHIQCRNDLPPSPGIDTSTKGCRCAGSRTKCTMGLHTIHSRGGISRIQHTRVEKCGQRGVEGKYCMHFHLMESCPECVFKGNAIEYGHQRGIIIHGTHLSKLEDNVINDIRGAGVYIEDGNEMYNNLKYNVIICPWRRNDPNKYGCAIPGTDNHEADTSVNQAGIFAISAVNNWIGNRAAGSYNGMFIDPDAFGAQGRGAARGKLCPRAELLGRFEGNTFHSHERFGTYILNKNYPKNTGQSISNNGFVDQAECKAFTSDGDDNGASAAFVDHVDYHNGFVGQYEAGDIGYSGHTSTDNTNLIYWKETKNFADGCSAHISKGYYKNGNIALPDQGTFIIEDTTFDQGVHLEPNHHCNVGTTGVLCMPQYVLDNVTWNGGVGAPGFPVGEWAAFDKVNEQGHSKNQNYGGIFVLSPKDAELNRNRIPGQSKFFFPAGYSSLVSNKFDYLLSMNIPIGGCALASAINNAEPGVDGITLSRRYGNGILCKPELRALKIYSRGLLSGSAPDIILDVWNGDVNNQIGDPITSQIIPYHQVGLDGQTKKQGYSMPVIPGTVYSYKVSLSGGGDIPDNWIIEFSDNVIGNRYVADILQLVVQGRSCGPSITSQHDRRYIWGGFDYLEEEASGRGACTVHSDMLSTNCTDAPSNGGPISTSAECPEACNGSCGTNEYCDCGSKTCECRAGFAGEICDLDVCAAARCSSHGICTATYLGGSLPVSREACVCEKGWSGPLCDNNPCEGKTCSGHGACKALGDTDAVCECDNGFSGENCELTCDGYCNGRYPFGCAADIPGIAKYFCGQNGGCAYSADAFDPGPSDFCAYQSQGSIVCECTSQNDCKVAGQCNSDGTCPAETNLPNGTPCNSIPYGSCLAGVCVGGSPSFPPTPSAPIPVSPSPVLPIFSCSCSVCTEQVLNSDAGGHTCQERIHWLQSADGGSLSENDACVVIAHDEFPDECGACDPIECGGDSYFPSLTPTTIPAPTLFPSLPIRHVCGCSSCSGEILDSLAGDFSCRARISWLQSIDGGNMLEYDACIRVASDFPSECGACNSSACSL